MLVEITTAGNEETWEDAQKAVESVLGEGVTVEQDDTCMNVFWVDVPAGTDLEKFKADLVTAGLPVDAMSDEAGRDV